MYAFKSSGIKLRDDHYYSYRDFRSNNISANGKKGESQFQTNREDKTKNGHEMEERFNKSNDHRHVRDLEQPYVRY
jgi:hypothetical protein